MPTSAEQRVIHAACTLDLAAMERRDGHYDLPRSSKERLADALRALYDEKQQASGDAKADALGPWLWDVQAEALLARERFGAQSRHTLALALMEEVGELAKALLEGEGEGRVWAESIQVAAMALRIVSEPDLREDPGSLDLDATDPGARFDYSRDDAYPDSIR